MFKISAKLQKIFYSAKKLRHKMSFLLKIDCLVVLFAAKVMPNEEKVADGYERWLRMSSASGMESF